MKNIFIHLKSKTLLKQEPLLKLLEVTLDEEAPLPPLLEQFFARAGDPSDKDNAELILRLIGAYPQPEVKEKLFALLVFFVTKLPGGEAGAMLGRIEALPESIFTRVRFFSLLYKSSSDNELKKRLITGSISLIEKESKISIFSNFVQNFDRLISALTFTNNEYVELYLKLINYLEKHAVYKKLWKHYIVQCLLNVAPQHVNSPEVDSLFLKLLASTQVTEETVALVHKPLLNNNRFYPYLEALILGDFEKFAQLGKQALTEAGIVHGELERRVKIHAIPRILSGSSNSIATIVSYMQIAEILVVKKDEVEGYIIEAIQEGILKAKIDESSETIIINSVKFMALRTEERASLQKNISLFAARLESTASS